jgi:3-hydroxybutyrate dehydrogenase
MDGRVALVTGAGRGIGRATALLLARRGARVMAVSRTPETLDGLEAEGVAATLAIDLATRDACEQAVEETRRRLGPIELLVNNAGVGSTFSDAIFTQPLGDWQTTMAVNLDAPFHLTQLASADMRARGYGRIVMVSSTSGLDGSPDDVAYTSSKHGLIGLTRAVAQDVGSFGGTCNAVCPGWVYTPMADRSAASTARRSASRRAARPERDAAVAQARGGPRPSRRRRGEARRRASRAARAPASVDGGSGRRGAGAGTGRRSVQRRSLTHRWTVRTLGACATSAAWRARRSRAMLSALSPAAARRSVSSRNVGQV